MNLSDKHTKASNIRLVYLTALIYIPAMQPCPNEHKPSLIFMCNARFLILTTKKYHEHMKSILQDTLKHFAHFHSFVCDSSIHIILGAKEKLLN